MNFIDFKLKVKDMLESMSHLELYQTDMDKDELYQLYLDSFPEGTNPMYRERTEHDCSCCKQFIRNIGNVVAFIGNEPVSIWDITIDNDYQVVANAMANAVKSSTITGVYRHYEPHVGTDKNHEVIDGVVKEWNHFYGKLPQSKVLPKDQIPSYIGKVSTNKQVFEASLKVITLDAVDVVLDLIDQNSLYRGSEHKDTVLGIEKVLKEYGNIQQRHMESFLWQYSSVLGDKSKFKNTVIGTLLVDISEGKDLESAVKSFEAKVAPENYKRPKALITQGMINKANEKIIELGLQDSLARRYAVTEDITVNNVLFADRSAKKVMEGGILDILSSEVSDNKPNLDKVQEVSIKEFISNVLPKAESLELMLDNNHESNLVSLIAPEHSDAPNMLKWGNNFSWSYNGEVADSMKDKVKEFGGKVEGDLRFSIMWNESGDDNVDLDAHCKQPSPYHEIFYSNKGRAHKSSGMLDVDIVEPRGKVAVENIIFSNKDMMKCGKYQFFVHNYSSRSSKGFKAEIEFGGNIYKYECNRSIRGREDVAVADITMDKGVMTIHNHLGSTTTPKQVWGVSTNKWNKVSMVMNSPNHWDGETTGGNKHYFFMLENCINPDKARGFYNEFLSNELTEHRKVFEVLASKMKTNTCDNQLSGVGFSETLSNSVLCKVSGSFNRVIKIKF